MLRRFTHKRLVVAAVTAVGMLALAAGAFAYFTSTGSGTGQAKVGSSTAFTVSVGQAAGGPLYPGTGSETLAYTIANPAGSGSQDLSAVSVTVASKNGDIIDGETEVTGCSSDWFTASNSTPAPLGEIADGAQVTGTITVKMQDVAQSQDACQGHSPDINVNAS